MRMLSWMVIDVGLEEGGRLQLDFCVAMMAISLF
jgi:hypothetical protein